MSRFFRTTTSFLTVLSLFFLSNTALAAQLTVGGPSSSIVEQPVAINIFLDTGNEAVNAVEGKLVFPNAAVAIKDIRTGKSIIPFWVKEPTITGDGEVSFSGLTPGGVSTRQGLLFSVVLVPKAGTSNSQLKLAITNPMVLLSDGAGTATEVLLKPLSLLVKPAIQPAVAAEITTSTADTIPPEPFTLNLAQAASLYDGKWFIAFLTRDTDSGIDHYEIQERQTAGPVAGEWDRVENPYVLSDQSLRSYVYVRAIDRAGNDRIAELKPKEQSAGYTRYWFWCILIIVLILVYRMRKHYGRKQVV